MGAKNKVDWCLKNAKEVKEGKHRGLIKIKPSKEKARQHIAKAEHYIEASLELEKKFSDISASTTFYSIYHSLLAILAKFGYESGNQECTFAVIYSLIEDEKIDFEKEMIKRIGALGESKKEDITEVRERYQYGTELSMEKKLYEETLELAKKVLGKTKKIIEE